MPGPVITGMSDHSRVYRLTVSDFTLHQCCPNTQTAMKEKLFYMHLKFCLPLTRYAEG